MFKVGDVIVFNDEIKNEEVDASPGIIAHIVAIHEHEDDIVEIVVDVSEFEAENKSKWEAIYYDSNHRPTLKYPETKHYNPRFSCHFMKDEIDSGKYFKLFEDKKTVPDWIVDILKEKRSNFLNDDNATRRIVIEELMSGNPL
jgi:hypothetical protein